MFFRHILQFVVALSILTWSAAAPGPALAQHGGHSLGGVGHHGGGYSAGSSHRGGVGYYGGFGHYRGYGHYGLGDYDGSYGYGGWPAYRGYGYSGFAGDAYGLGAYPSYSYRHRGLYPYYYPRRFGFRHRAW